MESLETIRLIGWLRACLAAMEAAAPRLAKGMIVNDARWDDVVANAQLAKPAPGGLMEFCGFKVKVDDRLPDYLVVWTDDEGTPIHVTDLRKQ